MNCPILRWSGLALRNKYVPSNDKWKKGSENVLGCEFFFKCASECAEAEAVSRTNSDGKYGTG